MASTQLQRTSGTSTENYKYTFSAWVKRTGVLGSSSVNEVLFSAWDGSNNSAYIRFEDQNDNLQVYDKYGSVVDLNYQTDMKFRDPNAFYHIVVDVDGTRSANQRCKIYVNGSQVSCSNTTDTGGTLAMKTVTATNATRLGAIRTSGGAEYYFSGIMSHVHYIDGTGYDASYFGETDSTTGEWKIKTNVTGVTYGNNGFFVLKDGNSVTDQSGNSNNFTVGQGTLTKTEDNPSNVFATLNPLLGPRYSTQTFSNGNTTVAASGGGHEMHMSTLAIPNSGKYYYEAKLDAIGNYPIIGVVEAKNVFTNNKDINTYGYGYFFNGNIVKLGGSPISPTYSSYTTGDFIGVAVDCDNKEIYFSKNGTWQNSSDPANRTNPAITGLLTEDLMLGVNNYSGTWSVNFGNGAFGSTQLTGTTYQGNENYGIFKYPVPTGFRALCTKTLNL